MTFDEQLQRALDTFTTRLRDEVARQVRVVGDELAAVARSDPAPAEPASATGRLVEGIRAMSSARSLNEVLDTLVSCVGQESARAGVLLVRGDRFDGWRFVGFDSSFGSGDAVDVAHRDAGVIAEALQAAAVASAGATGRDGAPAFAQLKPGEACLAVPIAIAGQVVAVLYADAGQKPGTSNLAPGTLNAEPIEILTRFASQRLEALTAIKAARSITVDPGPPASAPSRPGRLGDSAEQHAAARRYARLLVSEIKLYHEPQVAEGRRERDLATRLGGEIARARTLYEQRVPAEVRQGTDYVYEELIRTLADGDAGLLDTKSRSG